jgi:hypothetical protein
MHPATRLLILLISAGFMVTGNPDLLVAGAGLSLVLHWNAGLRAARLVRMISRSRWLLASILILYAWSTPGAALLPLLDAYSPTWEGLSAGLTRCAVLIVILSLAHWLIYAARREQLIQGVYWLIKPLRHLGCRSEVLALRLSLVLETVPALQQRFRLRSQTAQAPVNRMERIAAHAANVLEDALNEADRAALTDVEIAAGQRPQLGDWLILIALTTTLTTLALLPY